MPKRKAAKEPSDEESAQSLLANGANPAAMDIKGKSPLYWAKKNGDFSISKLLKDALKRSDGV